MKSYKKYFAHVMLIDEMDYDHIYLYYYKTKKYFSDCFCIINNGKLVGTIIFEDILKCSDSNEMEFLLKSNCMYGSLTEKSKESVELFCREGKDEFEVEYVREVGKWMLQDEYYLPVFTKLEKCGVKVVKVSFPSNEALGGYDAYYANMNQRAFYSKANREIMEPIIQEFSPFSYDRLIEKMDEIPDYGNEKAQTRIFVIGPCIVNAVNSPNDALPCILRRKLGQLGIDIEIVPVIVYHEAPQDINRIFEYDITNHDIVIILEESRFLGSLGKPEIDCLPIFQNYNGKHRLRYNIPIHVTVYGAGLVIEQIIKEKKITIETLYIRKKILWKQEDYRIFVMLIFSIQV